ncbi:zinc transport system substrate-binding protein [Pullulanibacillus pueri]|uniref:High-affinity zinc uptake system binding-protein ZnuA n=1 Tax=Pullulanibacillus pueri TaxID=1437324 RepID=A0A8J2ZVV8_9BACL|nr:metal ABC transporter substrate-binding protein [Pullulanibacillus pueri]MBM7682570.1 zinc transport system substrate-binding protein [Pullulanibacillus pueri]GGH82341.1 high-affinity zinc uptake system binding-protein ZnuA [Pullulanibacillus pueri]
MSKRVKAIFILAVIGCLIALVGCGKDESQDKQDSKGTADSGASQASHKLHIATTFYPMYEFTKQIVKDKAQVDLLIPATVEPHDWDPSPKDIEHIQKSDLLVYNSPEMETWAPNVQKSVSHVEFVQASKGIDLMKSAEEEEGSNLDPHVWLDPVLAEKEVETITQAIVKKDPDNKAFYEKNSEDYLKQLQQLDDLFRTTLADAPKKDIITQHAAFGYLAKEYGLNQVPIAGLEPDQEPSAKRLAELKTFAQKNKINIIYFEEVASPKVAQALADEVGAKAVVLSPLEGLTKKEQEQGLDYIEMMKRNLDALKQSLLK